MEIKRHEWWKRKEKTFTFTVFENWIRLVSARNLD